MIPAPQPQIFGAFEVVDLTWARHDIDDNQQKQEQAHQFVKMDQAIQLFADASRDKLVCLPLPVDPIPADKARSPPLEWSLERS